MRRFSCAEAVTLAFPPSQNKHPLRVQNSQKFAPRRAAYGWEGEFLGVSGMLTRFREGSAELRVVQHLCIALLAGLPEDPRP